MMKQDCAPEQNSQNEDIPELNDKETLVSYQFCYVLLMCQSFDLLSTMLAEMRNLLPCLNAGFENRSLFFVP